MGYEVDILGVGEKSNSGDAIALRYGNRHGGREEQQIAIIDSGFKDDGQRMVDQNQLPKLPLWEVAKPYAVWL